LKLGFVAEFHCLEGLLCGREQIDPSRYTFSGPSAVVSASVSPKISIYQPINEGNGQPVQQLLTPLKVFGSDTEIVVLGRRLGLAPIRRHAVEKTPIVQNGVSLWIDDPTPQIHDCKHRRAIPVGRARVLVCRSQRNFRKNGKTNTRQDE